MTSAAPDRRAELAANLAAFRRRLTAACEAAGRDVADITVIAVTKTWPASDIGLLAELGVTDIGENKDQEAAAKAAQCADLPLTWHFVGQLQTNKCRSVVRYADMVHSIDRPRLVQVLAREARRAGRIITCLVQVNLEAGGADRAARAGAAAGRAGAAGTGSAATVAARGGIAPGQALSLADRIAAEDGLRLSGVMAVAPLGVPPLDAFRRLAAVAADVQSAHPGARVISAGMSGDLEEAIQAGATHVRVGTALLGARRAFVR